MAVAGRWAGQGDGRDEGPRANTWDGAGADVGRSDETPPPAWETRFAGLAVLAVFSIGAVGSAGRGPIAVDCDCAPDEAVEPLASLVSWGI